MPKKAKTEETLDLKRVEQMRRSPLHAVKPVGLKHIRLKNVHLDPTNPGNPNAMVSERYSRREPAMRDSFYILDSIVYPLVVTQKTAGSDDVILVDGHGRYSLATKMGLTELACIVYPPMKLEDRIRLRQVLGAAQEPFDAPLVLKDLRLLAETRKLDLANGDDMDLLLADLPINLGEKAQKQLKLLAKWPAELIHRIAIEHDDNAGVLGIDMLKELDSVVNTLKREHPEVFKSLGESAREKALEVYFGGKLRAKGQRSQDALRELRKVLKTAPKNDDHVAQLFNGDIAYPAFKIAVEELNNSDDNEENEPLKEYIVWLGSFTGKLTSAQKQLIKRAIKMSKNALEPEEEARAGAA